MATKKVICKECEKEIDLNSAKHVLLGTYDGEKVEDESYFHFNCFVKWYNQKVSEKAKNTTKMMQDKVQGLIANPQIAGLLGNIGGIDKIKGMLNTNLDLGSEELPNIKELFEEEKSQNDIKENGKPKRKKTTKKKVQ